MRAAESAQSQSVQLQDPLEVRKEHLHFLSIFARLLVKTGFCDGTSHIARRLMNAATDFANWRVVDNSATLSGSWRNLIAAIDK